MITNHRKSIDRLLYDTETGEVRIKLRDSTEQRKAENVDSVEVDTSGPVTSNASRNYVKYTFGSPVYAVVEERTDELKGTVINVHDQVGK